MKAQRGNQAAEYKADDFRPDILDCGGAMQPERAGNIAQKAGDAKAHVDGIAQHDQKRCDQSDRQSGKDDGVLFQHIHTCLL